jgi:hypothetical protein
MLEGVVRPGGFEPPTLCFGGTRSIHLSYGRAVPNSVKALWPIRAHRRALQLSDTDQMQS